MLTHQNFVEAGGSAVFPDLVMAGTIILDTEHSEFDSSINKGLEALAVKARKDGAEAVFNVRWEAHYYSHMNNTPRYRIFGTAYVKRK